MVHFGSLLVFLMWFRGKAPGRSCDRSLRRCGSWWGWVKTYLFWWLHHSRRGVLLDTRVLGQGNPGEGRSLQSAGEPPVGLLCPRAQGWGGIFGTRKEVLYSLSEAGTAWHLSENSRRLKSPMGWCGGTVPEGKKWSAVSRRDCGSGRGSGDLIRLG